MIFENATIITVDPARRIIRDGAIAVSGSRIAGVGKREDILEQFQQDDKERVDLEGTVVIPGLVNTHVHQSQALIRGCADDMALIEWLIKRVWVLQGNYDKDDARISAELCILEMLKAGTTAFVETMIAGHYGFDGIAQAVQSSGIRAALSKIVMDVSTYAEEHVGSMHKGMIEDHAASFQEALDMHDKWEGGADGRIQVWFGPRPPGGCTSELFREMMNAANERGMGVTIHMAEVKEDVEYIRNSFDMTPIEYCDSVGMVGSRVLLIHCVQLGGDDIRRLAETGTHVTHNPLSNSKLASGIAPIAAMLDAGVNVTLGTDGGPSNNGYDMINDMRWASYLQKVKTGDPTVTPVEAVLEMATINGAKAMGLDDQIGSIEVGKQADFVALDMNKPRLTPAPDPVSAIVCAGSGSDVDTVVIGGKTVVEGGQVLTMDEDRILEEADERARKVYERAGIKYGSRWPVV
jgi:cytosine/adenosine deaminase-related metal-dependent hydrolase